MFASRALPRMLEVVEDDRQALRESFAVLSSFADRRFPKNAELFVRARRVVAQELYDLTCAPAQRGARGNAVRLKTLKLL
eukprot:NODE_37944_length_244_cov_1.777778.p2 GENE.NODE_37944_length_244_cov_1.777778~~NODE_37944_length_244_cov_1.777778.p2  ORF type:complete len:80 (+),score=29.99 NODE_37944_length_244_cov_1.777778:2-241(+)